MTQTEHILKRPDPYIGSAGLITATLWVYDKDTMVHRSVKFNPFANSTQLASRYPATLALPHLQQSAGTPQGSWRKAIIAGYSLAKHMPGPFLPFAATAPPWRPIFPLSKLEAILLRTFSSLHFLTSPPNFVDPPTLLFSFSSLPGSGLGGQTDDSPH
jgi:hypothetical protein